ncbi:TVP38/TMEM64 family protein, partial [Micrococcus luteus]|uniref:TVP38/TMEM64 family protein n=2 Tax=Micrococcus luteus TaxID=1270 RepID=UPI00341F1CA5
MPSTAVPPRDSGAASTLPARTGHRGVSILRTAALVLVVAAFVWLALTVRLPGVDELRAQLDGFGWWSWLAFTVLYAAVALTPIPVTIMAVTAGVLFGAIEGTVLSVVGALLGSLGAYGIARAVGREVALRWLGRHAETVERRLEDTGFLALLTLRVAPGLPYWPVNYGAGALAVPLGIFAGSTAVGVIPGQLSLVAMGAFAVRPGVVNGVLLGVGWLAVGGLTLWAVRRWRRAARSAEGPARSKESDGPQSGHDTPSPRAARRGGGAKSGRPPPGRGVRHPRIL